MDDACPITVVLGLCAARYASEILELRHRDQKHAATFRDKGENLPNLPVPCGPDGFRDRYLEFARQRSRVLHGHYPVPINRGMPDYCLCPRRARVLHDGLALTRLLETAYFRPWSKDVSNCSSDIVVCFITSIPRSGPDTAPLAAAAGTGLKVASVVRFDKLATLDRLVIAGKIGDAPSDWLASQRKAFFGVFGFGQP